METQLPKVEEIRGELVGLAEPISVSVLRAASHTLFVKFDEQHLPPATIDFHGLRLKFAAREVSLGKCRFHPHENALARRKSDPPLVGDGRLAFLEDVYDFSAIARGNVIDLKKQLEQLPVLWGRKKEIRPSFRDYIAELVYDLQVYRSVFDDIDRRLADEPADVRAEVHSAVEASEYPRFRELFDRKLAELAHEVKDYSREEHERHGFYLRKHVWDLIRSSEFLLRTNLKPRGYAGDSHMMRMVYENGFRGPTVFSRFLHRHPVETPAAQAVRNRLGLLSGKLSALSAQREANGEGPLRFMSVACGPAWELSEVFKRPEDLARYETVLLDQDTEALGEAQALIGRLEQTFGGKTKATYLQESVRTMLRGAAALERWGKFGFLYSMGLFDYLTAPVAKVVLRSLYSLLEPGGELVIGNFHVHNPTQLYMAYWMDWVLLYRSEPEMLALAEGLEGAEAKVIFEDTGSQMFLCVRKPR